MKESVFQKKLKKDIFMRFPDSIIFKTDSKQMQGVPDLLILNGNHWCMLEVKNNPKAKHQSNQDLRVDQFNKMSYAAFIYPENEEAILNDMERLFQS